jgi:predicted Zn finger-like uncharacterized protein
VIVQCPYCATRYQLDAARLAGPNPMLKCSRCHHIFPAPSSKRSAPRAPAPKRPAADAGTLTLPFDDADWSGAAGKSDDPSVPELQLEEEFTLGTDEKPDALTIPQEAREPLVTPRVARSAAPEADAEDEAETEEPDTPRSDRRQVRRQAHSHLWPFFVFLACVVGAYAMVARALVASPALCDKLVGRLPLIGTLGNDRLLTRKVALSEMVGNYQRIKDGKEVFVISGKALNTAPLALHGVQITGTLYDRTGQTLDQKTIYCGNVISAKVLKDLTPQEVSILQKLSPPKRFMIEPGESSTFVIVFMDPPHEAVEFSTQVVAAQRQA